MKRVTKSSFMLPDREGVKRYQIKFRVKEFKILSYNKKQNETDKSNTETEPALSTEDG